MNQPGQSRDEYCIDHLENYLDLKTSGSFIL